MLTRRSWLNSLVVLVLVLVAVQVRADITSIAGTVQVSVQEFRSGEQSRTDQASEQTPTSPLPLQVEAQLSVEGGDPAAAASAAQFASPLLNQPNPEEFAIDLALLSVAETIRYTGRATTQEQRGIIFPATLFQRPGLTVQKTGRLFVDGALAVFSPTAGRDLTGANVSLLVTVVKQVPGQADETVFSGRVGLQGGPNAAVQQFAEGDFPTASLIRSSLASFIPDFAVFEVLIIPSLTINYTYFATIDQPFTLVATVDVQAANAEDQTGVAAVIGTPVDAIAQVIAAAQGPSASTKTITALQNERANPTGTPAFPQTTPPAAAPLCGLLGFEFLLGLGALVGLRSWGLHRRRVLTE